MAEKLCDLQKKGSGGGNTIYTLLGVGVLSGAANTCNVTSGKKYLACVSVTNPNYSAVTQSNIDGISFTGGTITKRQWVRDPSRGTQYADYALALFEVTATANAITLVFPTNVTKGNGFWVIELG